MGWTGLTVAARWTKQRLVTETQPCRVDEGAGGYWDDQWNRRSGRLVTENAACGTPRRDMGWMRQEVRGSWDTTCGALGVRAAT